MQLRIWNMLEFVWRCYFSLKPMFIFTDFLVNNGENSIFLDFSKWWEDRFDFKPVMKQLFFRNAGHWFVTLRSCALCLFTSCMTSNRTAHNFDRISAWLYLSTFKMYLFWLYRPEKSKIFPTFNSTGSLMIFVVFF